MRPVIVAWLVRHGWPAWIAPDYATMVGIATLAGAILVLRQAERDRVEVHVQARALIWAYLGALVGGYLFEWIRMIPVAIASRSLAPIVFAGRAAYGGLIFGAIAPVVYLRRRGAPFLDFLDRATIGMGIAFACVRFGCFLEGCDFGRPTASWLGVRFPAGSPAADAHALSGWVPVGAASLPVHATELYESAVGIVASLLALRPLRGPARTRTDGAAFATWLVVYACGRFLLELLRGDVERGRYASLSTAQWISVLILCGVLHGVVARRGRAASVGVALVLLFVAEGRAAAQSLSPLPALPPAQPATPPPAAASSETVVFVPPAAAPPPAPAPKEALPADPPEPARHVTLRLALATGQTIARPDIPSGWLAEVDALYRLRVGPRVRFDVGLEGRRFENVEAVHVSLGLVGEAAFELGRRFELLATLAPHHTWFDFKSDFYSTTNAYGVRYGVGAQIPIERIVLGATPLAFTTTSSTTVGVISVWEPRLWVGLSF